ncbi:DUF6599 family protein [Granulicella arctica]|uniref:Uncharacterized protein n=1 Tax=Granulicella arctica TaxID=940613 RepID=A0A7Y9TFY8_9BACT|nr:DUF6599 family protein [Granulicella arctica]NYF78145.1 hypothetical protein [Granulicella arctica]
MSASLLAQAAPVVLNEPAAPLLPQRFGAWEMQAPATTSNDASQIDAAHVAELQEDGFNRFSTAKYVRGGATLNVQALQFVDATGASAALSLYRASHAGLRAMPAGQKLGTESAAGDGEVLLRTGNTIVIANSAQVQPSELQALAVTLPKISGPRGMSPLLPTLLPGKGLAPESVRYSLGPVSYAATGGVLPAEILGFEKSAEEVTANYVARSGKGTLTLLLYPTPQIAGDRGRGIAAWVNAHHDGLGTVKMRREGPLVLMTTGGFAADDAQQMIENIHLQGIVTWDKPMPHEFHSEVRKTASLLMSIAILSGVLMLAAVLLGLFLGVGRASIRVLMGKPAASEPEFLGLGLERGPTKAIRRQDDPAVG